MCVRASILICGVVTVFFSVLLVRAEDAEITAADELVKNITELLKNDSQISISPEKPSLVDGSRRSHVDLDTWVAPLDIQKNFVYYLSGFDEDNRPVWIGEVGKWKMREYVEQGGQALKDLEIYFEQAFHRYNQSISLRSTPEDPVTDGVVILDMEDYDIFQLASIPALQLAIRLAREVVFVARRMERGYFVNVNYVAERFINLLKPILNESLARTDVYGTNKAKWIPRLLKRIPKESLAEWYGGSKDFKPIAVYG